MFCVFKVSGMLSLFCLLIKRVGDGTAKPWIWNRKSAKEYDNGLCFSHGLSLIATVGKEFLECIA